MSEFDDGNDGSEFPNEFDARARAAGRGLGGIAPTDIDPSTPRRRLRRRRVVATSAAVLFVAAVGGGVALARDGGGDTKVDIAAPDTTTTEAPGMTATTEVPGTTTAKPASTTTIEAPATTSPPPPPSSFPDGLSGVVTARSDKVAVLWEAGEEPLLDVPGALLAYRLHAGLVAGTDSSVVVNAFGNTKTLPDMTLVGAGVYKGHSVALTLDLHPDVLHDNWKWVSIYDLANGQLTRTNLSIAPGTKLDRVSVAGDLFVMSGASSEGGPFVLYRHVDGSFDETLPNIVAGQLGIGTVGDAVISPDGTRIAYMLENQELVVNDVHSGKILQRVRVTTREHQHGGPIDFDGRWAVVRRFDSDALDEGLGPVAVAVDTAASTLMPVEVPGALGAVTIDRG